MALYFIFGWFHQDTSVLIRTFSNAIDGYFFTALNVSPDDDTGLYPNTIPIYLKDQFITLSLTCAQLLLAMPAEFPCANDFLSDGFIEMRMEFRNSENYTTAFDSNNLTSLPSILSVAIPSITVMTLTTPYTVRQIIKNLDRTFYINVTAMFILDLRTNIFTLDFAHFRDSRRSNIEWEGLFDNGNQTIPLGIALFAALALFLSFIELHATFNFAKTKSVQLFQRAHSIFWRKVDKWTLFGIVVHVLSVFGGALYWINGLDHRTAVPPPLIVIGIAAPLHCILMIRYFEPSSFTRLIVQVAARSAEYFVEFLFGCLIVLAGYLVFGMCLFGSYNVNFESWVTAAEVLIAVVHGDTIADRFEAATDRPDISYWASIVYWSVWVFFSLTIMFNISLSIFEHVLEGELDQGIMQK
jgi:hypothetical protein